MNCRLPSVLAMTPTPRVNVPAKRENSESSYSMLLWVGVCEGKPELDKTLILSDMFGRTVATANMFDSLSRIYLDRV
ncbi:hypothetical protein KC333_g49 [Hortaea werneckii]|nr:hypothetical protein KC333_g49 [Hortaea werneckii]